MAPTGIKLLQFKNQPNALVPSHARPRMDGLQIARKFICGEQIPTQNMTVPNGTDGIINTHFLHAEQTRFSIAPTIRDPVPRHQPYARCLDLNNSLCRKILRIHLWQLQTNN